MPVATRIDPVPEDTKILLAKILTVILVDGNRASFLVDQGTAYHMMARIRTMMSRKRKQKMLEGGKIKRFRMMQTVHPETHNGKRYDCIVLWRQVEESHWLMEKLEDMLTNV